jgi:hypothetical protein
LIVLATARMERELKRRRNRPKPMKTHVLDFHEFTAETKNFNETSSIDNGEQSQA